MRCLALEYHDIVRENADASGFPGGAAASYKIHRSLFDEHLEAIAGAGAKVFRIDRLAEGDAKRPLVLTFDDGGVAALHETAPALARHSWPGHFFVTTGRIGTPGFLGRSDIVELKAAGHVIGSHSVSHPVRFAGLSRSGMIREWAESRDALAQLLSLSIDTASVPGGYFSRLVAETAAEAGYKWLFTSEPTTGVHAIGGCRVVGRYTLRHSSPARAAAALASGDHLARGREWALWNAKKAAKVAGLRPYLAIRKRLLDG